MKDLPKPDIAMTHKGDDAIRAKVERALLKLNASATPDYEDVTTEDQYEFESFRALAQRAKADGWNVEERAMRGPGLCFRFAHPG